MGEEVKAVTTPSPSPSKIIKIFTYLCIPIDIFSYFTTVYSKIKRLGKNSKE